MSDPSLLVGILAIGLFGVAVVAALWLAR